MVYVQDINGKPLMPTTRYGKVKNIRKVINLVFGTQGNMSFVETVINVSIVKANQKILY